ncbi:PREDICTED: ankyrin-3-like [Branchiostoma belcheri]|uniref:Ankyrin-3-like n=1 Tax=Branchiostoma belcheri TaxID=7741 RepID=A0A6P4Z9G5_BRABE|nr:PREDICTED: ankyrin-3-like [Branchiostoma belcheri]
MDQDFIQTVEGGSHADVATKKEEKFAEGDEKISHIKKELLEDDAKDEGIGSFEVVTVTAETLPAESGDHDGKFGEADAGMPQASEKDKPTVEVVNEVEKDEGGSKSRKRKSSREVEESTDEEDTDSEESYTSEGETETDESETSDSSESEKEDREKKQDGGSKVKSQKKEDSGDTLTSIDTPALLAEGNSTAAEPPSSTLRRRKRKSREDVKDETKEKKETRPQQSERQLEEETNLPIIIVTVTCCLALVLYSTCNHYIQKAEKATTIGGRTPLHAAAIKGDVSRLMRLLAPKDIDINKQDSQGDTALMLAIRNKKEDVAMLLLSDGASHWSFNLNGEAAIHEAATNGLAALITNLVEYGADPELQSRDGWTPLMKAVKADELETVRALLEKGNANPNTKSDSGGLTPLHLAAQKTPNMVSLLAKAGGNVNARDEIFGLTPLHVAATECNSLTVRELLKRGADDWLEAHDGTRPRHVIGKKVHKGHAKNAQCDGVKRLLMA